MAKKKKKGKKKGKKASGSSVPVEETLKGLSKSYTSHCEASETSVAPEVRKAFRRCLEDEKLIVRFILTPAEEIKVNKARAALSADAGAKQEPAVLLPVHVYPLFRAILDQKYTLVKEIFVWQVPLNYMDVAELGRCISTNTYPIKSVSFEECLLQEDLVKRLATSIEACKSIQIVSFDYNNFSDAGCRAVCNAFSTSKHILSVSMNYCCLTASSGAPLSQLMCQSTVRELFLDGNELGCLGTNSLLKPLAQLAEDEWNKQEEEERAKAQEEIRIKEEEKAKKPWDKEGTAQEQPPESNNPPAVPEERQKSGASSKKGGKKKRKRKKKKKKDVPPPEPGPYIYKLHLADNGIDINVGNETFVNTMRIVGKFISYSKELVEVDLDGNQLGDIGGLIVKSALEARKESKRSKIKITVTPLMASDTLKAILKLGAGKAVKKKRKKKKKKK